MEEFKLLILLKENIGVKLATILTNKNKISDGIYEVSLEDKLLMEEINRLSDGTDYILIDKNFDIENIGELFEPLDNKIESLHHEAEAYSDVRISLSDKINDIVKYIIDDDIRKEDALSKYRPYELDAKYMLASNSVNIPDNIVKLLMNALNGDFSYVFGKDPKLGFFLATEASVIYGD